MKNDEFKCALCGRERPKREACVAYCSNSINRTRIQLGQRVCKECYSIVSEGFTKPVGDSQ